MQVLPQPVVCLDPPPVTRWVIRDIDFIPLEEQGRYYLAMTASHYKNLAYNWNALVVSVQERMALVDHYKRCITRHNESVVNQNSD